MIIAKSILFVNTRTNFMKKFFLTMSFLALSGLMNKAAAEVVPLSGLPDYEAQQAKNNSEPKNPLELPPGMPNPNDENAVREFFKKRFEEAAHTEMTDDIDWSKPSSTSVVPPPEFYERQKEEKKSTFEKIYEEALAAIHQKDAPQTSEGDETADVAQQAEQEAAKTATRFFIKAPQEEALQPQEEKIPTVSATLPSGRRILAPAMEHIPYFLSYIDIQSNGYIKVEDTITIVANGQKFAYGLNRVFPKRTYYQGKRGHRIEIILNSVTINGTKVPYITEESGRDILLKPKYNQPLEPGVYTYKFDYIINHKLQSADNLTFMDWNMTGRAMNAFITSANAIVSLPQGFSFRDAEAIISRGKNVSNQRTNVFNLAKNVLAFSNKTPLFNGEEMNIITVMDKNVFIKNYDKNFSTFLNDWGNIVYAGLGFVTILISFILSLLSLKKEQRKKYTPSYSGALMRSISIGKFDRLAYVAELLDLYRKNAIDLIYENNRYFLVAKNIKNSKLSKIEKKALGFLFSRKNTQIEINVTNNLKFKKTKRIIEKSIKKQIKKYRLMQNIGYIIFSIIMLLLTEFFIAGISINLAQSLTVMISSSLLFAFYIWILRHKFKYRLIGLLFKSFSIAAIILIALFCSIYTGIVTALLIAAMIATIFAFSRIFSEHNNFINDAKNAVGSFREYLISRADAINLSRDFINQQSNIFALGIQEYFPPNVANKNYYRLDIAENIKQALIGVI